jgi:hypothetical protein
MSGNLSFTSTGGISIGGTGTIAMGGNKITGLGTPTLGTDAVTKDYVDNGMDSGVYTPTLTNVTNVSASTSNQGQWIVVGNVATVSGAISVDPTAAGNVEVGISLPVASNFTTTFQCRGVAAAAGVAGQSAAIVGDATNNRATLQWVAVDTTNQEMSYTFMYEILV